MKKDFSVVTPSYNQGNFIEKTINSVLLQKDVTFDYFIIDGGSNDQTLDILKKYKTKINFVSEADNGQADAVNKGIRKSDSKYIAWINSDDIYYKNALNEVKQTFEKYPNVDLVYGNAFHINEKDAFIENYPVEDWNIDELKNRCFICQPAAFFRRSVIQKFGYLNENLQYCMDYEFWLRLSTCNIDAIRINKVLAGSRMYDDNKTKSQIISVHREIVIMLKEKFKLSPDRWIFNYSIVIIRKLKLNEKKFMFKFLFAFFSILVSLRFNFKISRSMVSQIYMWFKNN